VSMWMFQYSDRGNRYVTGGAVLAKWNHFAKKLLTPERFDPQQFMKKLSFHGRDSWIRRDLESIFDKLPARPRSMEEITQVTEKAKKIFVNDVIADTQWLYGIPDAPLITNRFGVISRTGVIFQSWWMNYMTALEKWFRGAGRVEKDMRLERFITWMTSTAVAGALMTKGIGFKGSTAASTVGLGPLPSEFSEFTIPPSWAPFYHSLSALVSAGGVASEMLVTGEADMTSLNRKKNALIRSTFMFFPGGLQIEQSVKRSMEEGFPGFAKSIIGYNRGN
jgi:hypothetical protein